LTKFFEDVAMETGHKRTRWRCWI